MASTRKPKKKPAAKSKDEFDKKNLWSSVIAIPLLEEFEKAKRKPNALFPVIIDLNLDCRGGREAARRKVLRFLRDIVGEVRKEKARKKSEGVDQYLFMALTAAEVRELVLRDQGETLADEDLAPAREEEQQTKPAADAKPPTVEIPKPTDPEPEITVPRNERGIYRVWPDFEFELEITKSISTVKADAAHRAFYAYGEGIVWAVLDSGIERHPHFVTYGNLDIAPPLAHRDFTDTAQDDVPQVDDPGHGTHVAGIIAGEMIVEESKEAAEKPSEKPKQVAATVSDYLDEKGNERQALAPVTRVSGMAPRCKLVSLRVSSGNPGKGNVSSVIAALTYIQEINGHGRRLLIHGVNMSLGYPFDPKWFACGQSPLCVEVNRLVRSGVVVVVAAGNAGYVNKQLVGGGSIAAGENLTIKDPGNSDLAITVGSTHRDMPHMYGVSYFSSKGPTGDGRLKPDLLAPGEKILSCAAKVKNPTGDVTGLTSEMKEKHKTDTFDIAWYVQNSGTSMATPHVSGAIAAFLSIRREFIGRPEEVKRIFMQAATDLGRERYFQGSGLVDLMRAIQSV